MHAIDSARADNSLRQRRGASYHGMLVHPQTENTPMTKYQLGYASHDGGAPQIVVRVDEAVIVPLIRLLPQRTNSPNGLLDILQDWPVADIDIQRAVDAGRHLSSAALPERALRWLPPIVYPRKLICIGTNYHDHMKEMGVTETPAWPYSFLKPPTTTLVGSGAAVVIPRGTTQTDWEIELAVIIGRKAHHCRGPAAMEAIAGYSVFNDISVRDWLAKRPAVGIDWMLHKAFDGFGPLGPWLTPVSHVRDPQNLAMALDVDGVAMQRSNTAQMVFGIQALVEHLSAIMTLEPGDVIATGTPAGVGFGRKPQTFLKPGDVITATIEGLGTLTTTMVADDI